MLKAKQLPDYGCSITHYESSRFVAARRLPFLIELSTQLGDLALARGLSIDSRAYVTGAGQSKGHVPPAPIRMPEWSSRLSGQRRILFT